MKRRFVCFAVFCGLLTGGALPLTYAQTRDPSTTNIIPPIVTIYATDPLASETGPDSGTFTLVRNGPTNTVLAVFYTLGGTASNGVDYEMLGGSVVIPEGSFIAQITVTPIDDSLVEGTESVVARLVTSPLACAACDYRIGVPSEAVVKIADNDGQVETNLPPFVQIATPSEGAMFPSGADILIAARAQDFDGFVATVEFFEGTNSLGVTTNNPLIVGPANPFMLVWSNVPPGIYSLRAKATDNQGAGSVSQPVHIAVGVTNVARTVVNIVATDDTAREILPLPPWLYPPCCIIDSATFTVTRTDGTNFPLTVYYRVGGTAINGVDYVRIPDKVTIPAGAWSADILVYPIDDFLIEGTETVTLTLEEPACITLFPPPPGCYVVGPSNEATAFILDNDTESNLPPVVTIVATDPTASEAGPDPGTFTVSRTGPTNSAMTVFYSTRGIARNGIDYQAISNYVVILAGASSADITIIPIDDTLVEPPETVEVQLRPMLISTLPVLPLVWPPYMIGYPSNAVVTIADNDVGPTNLPPEVHIVTPRNGAFYVGPTNILLGADAFDRDGAVAQVEFFEGTNSLGLARGPLRTPFGTYLLTWSNVAVGEYTLTAKATDNVGAIGVSAPVHVSVVTNLPPPSNRPPVVTIVARDPIASEGSNFWQLATGGEFWLDGWNTWGVNLGGTNTATFVVRRTDGTNADLTVDYSAGGTASNGVDYLELSGSVVIPAGRHSARITVVPIDDDLVEGIETVLLTLFPAPDASNMPPAYLVGYPARAAAIILDNDQPRPPCVVLADHMFHLCLPATNGFCFRVEATLNFIDWQPVCTNVVTDGALHFIDPDAEMLPFSFYRAVPEPGLAPDD